MAPKTYGTNALIALRDDKAFQERFSADAELDRLLDPQADENELREELAQMLGVGRRIAGVNVPPATLGDFEVLTIAGNEFAKRQADFSLGFEYQLQQFTEAMYVLANGHKAVQPIAHVFRWRRYVQAWKPQAATSLPIAQACMDAEQKIAEAMKPWDEAVAAWASANLKIGEGENIQECFIALDEWLALSLQPMALFPNIAAEQEAKPRSANPFGSRRILRRACLSLLVRCLKALTRTRSGGKRRLRT